MFGFYRSMRIGFLLPSLLASLGTLWLVYDLGRRLWTHRVGLAAAWLLLFALQFTFQAKKAQIDPVAVFWITLANYGLLRHLLLGPDWRWYAIGFAAAGVGVATKGVGFLALLMLAAGALVWGGVTMIRRGNQKGGDRTKGLLMIVGLLAEPVK